MKVKERVIYLSDRDVPLGVVYRSSTGEEKQYELKPGGRTFGLSLQKASDWMKRALQNRR